MRIGLERAGWQIAFANDIDEDKWQMYRDHFGDTGEFLVGDVHMIDANAVPVVALATASFPVTTFHWRVRAKDFRTNNHPRFREMPQFPDVAFSLD